MICLLFRTRKRKPLVLCIIALSAYCTVIFLAHSRTSKQVLPPDEIAQWTSPSEAHLVQQTGDSEVHFVNHTKGRLNAHIWLDLCGFYVHRLRQTPLFPRSPHQRLFISDLKSTFTGTQFGQRIFGFLHPRTSGFYQFAISSDDTSELWLSFDEDPTKVKLVASVSSPTSPAWTLSGDYKKYPTQISREIHLEAGRTYFIEVLHKQDGGGSHVEVYWKLKASHSFEIIRGTYLSPFYPTDLNDVEEYFFGDHDNTPSHTKDVIIGSDEEMIQRGLSADISWLNASGVLPLCAYEPSYIVKWKLKRYEGALARLDLNLSSVWPRDGTNIFSISSTHEWSAANALIGEEEVRLVSRKFMDALERRYSRKFFLEKVTKVEQTVDKEKGDRFFVELQLGLQADSNTFLRLSEYVFRANGSSELCFPVGYQWHRNATIYFILPVKNQGGWVRHFLKEMMRLHDKTRDDNFVVIVIDFASDDVDVEKMLNASSIHQNIILIKKSGPFHKTLAIQEAASRVPNPHDIVFLFDLHIDVPLDLLDSIRKHTIQGKMAYSPVVGRLECGTFPANPKGFWQLNGYGVMAVYKSDWDRFKGMNVKDFTTRWGGEDWDLLDRILGAQLEVLQLKQPGLLHYYHTRNRIWNH